MQVLEIIAVFRRDPFEQRSCLHLIERGRRQHGEASGIHLDQVTVGRDGLHAFGIGAHNRAPPLLAGFQLIDSGRQLGVPLLQRADQFIRILQCASMIREGRGHVSTIVGSGYGRAGHRLAPMRPRLIGV
jgi:hypothetical protein